MVKSFTFSLAKTYVLQIWPLGDSSDLPTYFSTFAWNLKNYIIINVYLLFYCHFILFFFLDLNTWRGLKNGSVKMKNELTTANAQRRASIVKTKFGISVNKLHKYNCYLLPFFSCVKEKLKWWNQNGVLHWVLLQL